MTAGTTKVKIPKLLEIILCELVSTFSVIKS
uniref:Uncharacterized protein n=1 Tax=Arundo donax TaxID=35708 RepID=A0A0A8ZUP5_ARUDO